MPTLSSQKAFSLVEAIIVIAVICILAALALPAFHRVMQQYQITQSSSNLRQTGVLFHKYALDNNSSYPRVATSKGGMWMQKLWPYAYPNRTFPGFGVLLKGTVFYTPLLENTADARTFGMNLLLENKYLFLAEMETLRYDFLISQPSQVALVGDSKNLSSFKDGQVNFRNLGKVNVLFLDGHVSLLSPSEVPTTTGSSLFWQGSQE